MTTLLAANTAVKEAQRRAQFYRSWGAAFGMGATHPNALKNLGMQFGGAGTERLRVYLGDAIEKRATLMDAIKRAPPGLLEPFEVALLRLGEETGALDRSLRVLADWWTGQHKLLLKLWGKSAYPLFLTLFAAVALPLPKIFAGRMDLYLWYAIPGVLLWWFFGGSVVYIPARFASGRGKWVRARLSRALTTAMEAGAPVDRALELAVASASNPELDAHLKRVPLAKRRAQPISVSLRGAPHVPPELLSAIEVAESTGNWSDSVGRMGEMYEEGF